MYLSFGKNVLRKSLMRVSTIVFFSFKQLGPIGDTSAKFGFLLIFADICKIKSDSPGEVYIGESTVGKVNSPE